MKEYLKPFIEDEEIELEDVIANSLTVGGEGDADSDGDSGEAGSLWPLQP